MRRNTQKRDAQTDWMNGIGKTGAASSSSFCSHSSCTILYMHFLFALLIIVRFRSLYRC